MFGQLRTTTDEQGEPWFVGKDVADALGYEAARNAIAAHVDDEDKLTHQISASGQMRNVTFINESGLYSLVMSSKLPSAKVFKRWVTSEALPSIRKHGMYATDITIDKMLEDPDAFIGVLVKYKEERQKRLQMEIEMQKQQKAIEQMKPVNEYANRILNSKSTVTVTQIAQDYGMSSREMNKMLHDLGIQYKVNGQWIVYQQYKSKGYVHSRTFDFTHHSGQRDSRMLTEWTQSGRLFLYNSLKARGILPLIERHL